MRSYCLSALAVILSKAKNLPGIRMILEEAFLLLFAALTAVTTTRSLYVW
jgi:hypothetical protein